MIIRVSMSKTAADSISGALLLPQSARLLLSIPCAREQLGFALKRCFRADQGEPLSGIRWAG